jgi:hypothetical protein
MMDDYERVAIVGMLAEEIEVLGENLPQYHFFNPKSHKI